ncbi:MAG: hypothetical protein FWG53_00230, partial [Clostridiales bacterium]|nr:hypothetical protein [Clostridiales bacterium]
FIVGGVELDPSDYDTYYDFGGLEIMRVYDEDEYWYGYTDGYYWTFGDGIDPAAQVAIKKKP